MDATSSGQLVEILLVEDNEGDARLAREAMIESKMRNTLHHVYDGEEAMAFLHRVGKYADAPRPSLILLDLNLPKKDGREVLAEVKADDDLKRIPIVVLTTSSADKDIFASYDLHANCYITKPVDLAKLIEVVRAIDDFWLSIVRLPDSIPRRPPGELPAES